MENDIVRMLFLRRQRQKKRWKIKTISGTPPLSFKAKAGTLKDYKIYGNTANGESVGDLETTGEHAGEYKVPVTVEGKNLFDINNLEDHYDISVETGLPVRNSAYSHLRCAITTPINVSAGDYYLTFNKNIAGEIGFIVSVFENNTLISRTSRYNSGDRIRISSGNNIYIGFHNQNVTAAVHPSDISNIMLNSGSTALPYEPYHAPVTTPIYLPEPIKMVGDETEYIDYGEQKMHRIGADDIDVTLPALPTLTGTNVLSVGTAVQPSGVEITGRIKKGE